MAQKRSLPDLTETPIQAFYTSHEIHDRGSKFMAHFHPFSSDPSASSSTFFSPENLQKFQSHASFSGAMHRVIGWRKPTTQQTLSIPAQNPPSSSTPKKHIYTTKSDEDGETHAGKHVEKVLNELDVAGVLVVARWFGGVLLGPVRFAHVQNVAREAVGLFLDERDRKGGKRVKVGESRGGGGDGVKVLDETEERRRMVRLLEERDRSIIVLRELLAEKRAMLAVISDGDEVEVGDGLDGDTKAELVVDSGDGKPGHGEKGEKGSQDEQIDQPNGVREDENVSPMDSVNITPTPDQEKNLEGQNDNVTGEDSSRSLSFTKATSYPPSPATLQNTPSPSSSTLPPSPKPSINYTTLPLPTLQKLSKARDATIAWILKELDEIDSQS